MRTIFLGCYAPHAFKGLIEGSNRKAAVEALCDAVGAKLVSLAFTRGEYDVVAVADMPDRNTGLGLAMAIHASGAFTKISILEELDMDQIIPTAQKAAQVYKPAG